MSELIQPKTAYQIGYEIAETLQWGVYVDEYRKRAISKKIEAAILDAVKGEREACAKIADKNEVRGTYSEADAHNHACRIIAESIRERG